LIYVYLIIQALSHRAAETSSRARPVFATISATSRPELTYSCDWA